MSRLVDTGTTSIFHWLMQPGKLYCMIGHGIDLYRLKDDGTVDARNWFRPSNDRDGAQPLLFLRMIEKTPSTVACQFLVGGTIMETEAFLPMRVTEYFKRIGPDAQ